MFASRSQLYCDESTGSGLTGLLHFIWCNSPGRHNIKQKSTVNSYIFTLFWQCNPYLRGEVKPDGDIGVVVVPSQRETN